MARLSIRELRAQISDEQIKNILAQFNVEPYFENDVCIVFPTCCHNLVGGSPKLYYYKNTKLFRCYTQCNELFDIFGLLIKMYKLRGKDITVGQAISLCDLDNSGIDDTEAIEVMQDFKYMQELSSAAIIAKEEPHFTSYDKKVLNRFPIDYAGLEPWLAEGIGMQEIQRFNIRYDKQNNAIIIPNYDVNGNLIGIRARNLNPDAKAKYAPIWVNGECYRHPTGKTFYGIYENFLNIERKQMAVIFEGEKSVLKFGTIYGSNENVALATLGQNITKEQIKLLLSAGVRHVILAYDADYETYADLAEKKEQYKKIAAILATYFNTSILLDYDLELGFKDSPIDKGKEIFERLLKERVNI